MWRTASTVLLFTTCADFNPDHYRFPCSMCGGGTRSAGGSSGGFSIGGAHGGGSSGGSTTGGGAVSGGIGGGILAGGQPDGTSGGTSGGLVPYTFAQLSIDQAATDDEIVSIAGTASDLYAGTKWGAVYHSTNGTQFIRVSALGSSEGKYFYMAPGGRLFVATGQRLGVCDSNCPSGSGYSWTTPMGLGFSVRFYAVCGSSPTNVFAIGHGDPNFGGLAFHFNGVTWSGPVQLGLSRTVACWLEGTDVLWVAGRQRVARLERGVASLEGADLSSLGPDAAASQWWYGIFGGRGSVHVVGAEERIMTRNAAGQWRLSLANPNQTAYHLRAIGGLSDDELFAVGDQGCSSCANAARIYRFDGAQWSVNAPPSFPYESLRSVSALPPSTILIGGSVRSGLRPTVGIIRGLR